MKTVVGRARTWFSALGMLAALAGCDDENVDARGRDGADATCAPAPREDAGADAGGSQKQALDCEVIVVGGGAGGLHTAFRLGDELGEGVCLFEKEARLGGRIYDVSKDGSDDGPRVGVGARRMMEGQDVVFGLADELGIEYEKVPYADSMIQARGVTGFSSDELNTLAYPALDDVADLETMLYDELRARTNLDKHVDFRSYVRATVGAENYQFLTDVFRFRADFEYPLDPRGYLDYLDEEWDVCCDASYPKGGMSEFIRRMGKKAKASGVRIFTSEPALEVQKSGTAYEVVTPSYAATAKRLVIAVDAGAFKNVRGDVADRIHAAEEFQQIIGVKVASITQWWPTAWWETAVAGKSIDRAWTTEQCLNFIEIPMDAYGKAQKVTRTVYDDDIRCVTLWEELARVGTKAVEAEIRRGLTKLFPDAEIPAPDKTFVQIWPNAWYWLRSGATITNAELAQWALEPLAGEAVSMVGESYNVQRSGWSDGAYKSSIATLNTHFGFDLPGSAVEPKSRDAKRAQKSRRNGQYGPSAGR